jgi:AcrR family transcriptional regulator/ferredoxin
VEVRVVYTRCEWHGQCGVVDMDLFPLDDARRSAVGSGVVVPEGEGGTGLDRRRGMLDARAEHRAVVAVSHEPVTFPGVVNKTKSQRGARNAPSPPPRQEDGRWKELLHISAELFAAQGYQSTTLQDIADQFGVLKGSLYHYIRSKDDLLFEIVHSVADLGMRNLRELAAVKAVKADPAARLRSVVRGHVLYLIDHLTETTVLLHEIDQLSPERRGQIPTQEYSSVLTGLIEDGQRAGVVKPDIDAHLATLAVLGAVNWVYRWYRSDGNRTPAEIADQYVEMLVGGLLVAH